MAAPYRVVYIAGRPHSGSTLLDLLLGSHSQVVGVGEIRGLSEQRRARGRRPSHDRCACGSPRLLDCPFWQCVESKVRAAVGRGLEDVDVYESEQNAAVFDAVHACSGARVIVDSSKDSDRLEQLLAAETFEVRPIQLLRSPFGVMNSERKKGFPLAAKTRRYTRSDAALRRVLAGRDHLRVRYEDLATSPREVLARIMAWLDLELEEAQLDWPAHAHHNVGGNRMRRKQDSTIRLDASWRRELTLRQKLFIGLRTLPTRRHARWLHPLWPRSWK